MNNADLIGTVLQSREYRTLSTYFDWLICPSISVEKMIADGLPVPKDLSDIGWTRGRPEFTRYGALFYHEFLNSTKQYENSHESFLKLQGKYHHTAKNLMSAVTSRKVIFVWSNSQNNLIRTSKECDNLDIMLSREVIDRIVDSGDVLSGQSAKYLFVTYEDRHKLVDFTHPRVSIHVLRKDSSTWEGDTEQWANVFRSLSANVLS